jgi:hypothetical protein
MAWQGTGCPEPVHFSLMENLVMPKKDFYEHCPALKALAEEFAKSKKIVIEVEDCSRPARQLMVKIEDCPFPARQITIPVNKPVYEWKSQQTKKPV